MKLFDKLLKKSNVQPQQSSTINDQVQSIELNNAKQLGTDLVEASYHRGCCGECAKYRKRWFSISGKDKRFPKMPVNYGCTCSGLTFDPVIYGISEPTYSDGIDEIDEIDEIIEYSNRPFIDDRDDEEKKLYDMCYNTDKVLEENEKFFSPYASKWKELQDFDRNQYQKLVETLPDIAPKSYSGYMRMKKNNTQNYQKLLFKAKSHNIPLEYSEDMKRDLEKIAPIFEQYAKVRAECLKYRCI